MTTFFTAAGSVMVAITRILPAHLGHRSASNPWLLRRRTAHATGTGPTVYRKRDEDVVAAGVAMAAHEALREVPAREVTREGVRHVARQWRGVGGLGMRHEGGVVLASSEAYQPPPHHADHPHELNARSPKSLYAARLDPQCGCKRPSNSANARTLHTLARTAMAGHTHTRTRTAAVVAYILAVR